MTATKLTDTQIQAMLTGCNGVTPGPWEREELFVYCNDALGTAVCELSSKYNSMPRATREINLTHITRCDPETIAAAMTELIERRKGDSAIVEACAKVAEDDSWDGLDCACGGGWKVSHAFGCPEDQSETIRAIAPPSPRLPERDASKPAEAQGLFRKFDVLRVDGSHLPGGKHDGCEYFVLDVDHDQHARAALLAYATACEGTHPQLSADLIARHGPAPAVALTREQIAEAMVDGFTEGNEAYVEQFGVLKMRFDWAVDAILTAQRGVAVTRPDRGGPA